MGDSEFSDAIPADIIDRYLAGEDPAALWLADGESLEEFLDDERRLGAAEGLLFHPVEPCRLLDTRADGLPLGPNEALGFFVDGLDCGLPAPEGKVLKRRKARAVLLQVRMSEGLGDVELALWPGEGHSRPSKGFLRLAADVPESVGTVIVSLCDEIAADPCVHGDLYSMASATVHATVDLLGYFAPLSPSSGVGRPVVQSREGSSPKSAVAPYWETGTSNRIFYDDGNVGIGTPKANSLLTVTHDAAVGGDAAATVTIDAATNTGSDLALKLRARSTPGAVDDLMVVRGDGHVGIGTNTPAAELHVVGRGRFEDDVILANNGIVRGYGAQTSGANGGIFFSAATPGSAEMNVGPGYGAFLMHNVYWDGTQWIQPRKDMQSQLFTVNHHHSASWWRGDAGGVDHGPVTLEPSMAIDKFTGHVGIGLINPERELDIEGGIQLTYHRDQPDESRWRLSPWHDDNLSIDSTTGDGALHIGREAAAKLVVGYYNNPTSKLTVVGNSHFTGNVGLGTKAPEERLEVAGNLRLEDVGGAVELQFITGDGGGNTKIVKSGGANALTIQRMNGDSLYTFGGSVLTLHKGELEVGAGGRLRENNDGSLDLEASGDICIGNCGE